MRDAYDWLKASNADRILLYGELKKLIDGGQLTWNGLFSQALKRQPGEAYQENFRRGLNSRKDSLLLYNFLAVNFPDQTADLERRLLPQRQVSDWSSFYRANRTDGLLAVVSGNVSDPSFCEPPGQTSFEINEPFYLQLDSKCEGHAVCLSGYDDFWFVRGLALSVIVPVQVGRQWVTRDHRADLKIGGLAISASADSTDKPVPTREWEPRPIEEYALIITDLETAKEIVHRDAPGYPIKDRHLDSIPALLKGSRKPWIIAWTKLHFVPNRAVPTRH